MTMTLARFINKDANTLLGTGPTQDILTVRLNAATLEADGSGINLKNEAVTEAKLNNNNAGTIHYVLGFDSRNPKEMLWVPQGTLVRSADRVAGALTDKLVVRASAAGRVFTKSFAGTGSGDDLNEVLTITLDLVAAEVGYTTAVAGWSGNTTVGSTLTQAITEIETIKTTYATITYVDSKLTGLKWKDNASVATTANITLSGVQTIDGVGGAVDMRVLVKNQSAGQENGVYLMKSGAWVRTDDTDTADEIRGMAILIREGSTHADSGWTMNTDGTIVIGTTPLNYVQFTGAGQITAGNGLTKTGNILSIDFNADSGLEFAAGTENERKLQIKLKANGRILRDNDGVYVDVSTLVGAGMQAFNDSGVLRVRIDYTATHDFTAGALQIGGVILRRPFTQVITLNGTQITNKTAALTNTPADATQVELHVIGGPLQERGVDYNVSTSNIVWTGLGLDGVLIAGDRLHVSYTY